MTAALPLGHWMLLSSLLFVVGVAGVLNIHNHTVLLIFRKKIKTSGDTPYWFGEGFFGFCSGRLICGYVDRLLRFKTKNVNP